MEQPTTGFHGAVRELDRTPRSALFEGRFGRLFRSLEPATFSRAGLETLATAMSADVEFEPDPDAQDPEENQGISAGYTYRGQFIDHDLTFDPASSLDRKNDPDALVDFARPGSTRIVFTAAVPTISRISIATMAFACCSVES
jgi:hypothetical protein